MLKILHTSDWHLGHTLHSHSRDYEFKAFFDWLFETLGEEEIDVLLVAGDIYDSANPSARAQTMLWEFLSRALLSYPTLQVVFVAGNHDSPARLEAPDTILRHFRIRIVGLLPRHNHEPDSESLLIPLQDSEGKTAAWLAAVPYLRPADLRGGQTKNENKNDSEKDTNNDTLIEGVRGIYAQVLQAALKKRKDNQALVATGHLYMTGSKLSELSERRILGGNQHALPADIFSKDFDYVALGHLHLAQKVGGQKQVRYSGSVIPLSMNESDYHHQVLVSEFEGSSLKDVRSIEIPRKVDLLRVPTQKALPLDEVLMQIDALILPEARELQEQPFLEVRVLLDKPEPDLRSRIEEHLDGKALRLVKISTEYKVKASSLAESQSHRSLDDLNEEDVFLKLYAQKYEGAPSQELLEAFYEIAESAREEAQ